MRCRFWPEPVSIFGSLSMTVPVAVHLCWAFHPACHSDRINNFPVRARQTAARSCQLIAGTSHALAHHLLVLLHLFAICYTARASSRLLPPLDHALFAAQIARSSRATILRGLQQQPASVCGPAAAVALRLRCAMCFSALHLPAPRRQTEASSRTTNRKCLAAPFG